MFHSYHQVANWCRMSFIHSMFPSIPMDPLTHSLEPSIGDSSLGTMPLGLIPAKRACKPRSGRCQLWRKGWEVYLGMLDVETNMNYYILNREREIDR